MHTAQDLSSFGSLQCGHRKPGASSQRLRNTLYYHLINFSFDWCKLWFEYVTYSPVFVSHGYRLVIFFYSPSADQKGNFGSAIKLGTPVSNKTTVAKSSYATFIFDGAKYVYSLCGLNDFGLGYQKSSHGSHITLSKRGWRVIELIPYIGFLALMLLLDMVPSSSADKIIRLPRMLRGSCLRGWKCV